ncbi:DUF4910 domain-containing protein [Mycoplasmatota bacterium]|nr:DUF4910 domain-containing protein [Mycoplasmatota bacterium]
MRKLMQVKSISILIAVFLLTLTSCSKSAIDNTVNKTDVEQNQVLEEPVYDTTQEESDTDSTLEETDTDSTLEDESNSDSSIEEDSDTNSGVAEDFGPDSLSVFTELQNKIDQDRAMSVIQYLTDVSPRIAGLDGEKAAGEYILGEFNKLGFASNLEEFPVKYFKANECNLKINDGNDTFELDSNCFSFSSSTPDGGLKRIPLIYGSFGTSSDVKDINMEGKIAVVKRGEITFRDKVIKCANRGAIGVIVINAVDAPLNSTLLDESPIPAVSVSLSEGTKIMDIINNEDASADLLVDTVIKDSVSNNIIGIKSSDEEDAKTLIIGAHYDSVDCPGANDNASGVAGLMELANILKDHTLPFNVHFMTFGSEEIGLIGSDFTVNNNTLIQENKDNIIGMINLDMIGKGRQFTILKAKTYTDDTIYNLASTAAKELNITSYSDYSENSDHSSFESKGIPVVFLTYRPYDPIYYHTKMDTIDTIDSTLIENTLEVVLKMITKIANK